MSTDDDFVMPSRIGAPELPPIVFEGRRYEQVMDGEREGLVQRTGLMVIRDAASGARLGVVSIYEVPLNPDLEADVQDVFFTRFELEADRRRLLIENEHGGRYVYDIDTGAVRCAE